MKVKIEGKEEKEKSIKYTISGATFKILYANKKNEEMCLLSVGKEYEIEEQGQEWKNKGETVTSHWLISASPVFGENPKENAPATATVPQNDPQKPQTSVILPKTGGYRSHALLCACTLFTTRFAGSSNPDISVVTEVASAFHAWLEAGK